MRLRAVLVPALLATSLLGGLPAAHAAGCGSTSDASGDAPSKTLDVLGASVAVAKRTGVVTIQLKVGQTSASGDPFMTAGASYYVDFKVGPSQYSVWRHVAPVFAPAPDVFGGRGVKPKGSMTPNTVTWTLPKGSFKGLRTGTDACSLTAYDSIQNSPAVDTTG